MRGKAVVAVIRYLVFGSMLVVNASAEPRDPGPNLPPEGRSAFDHLIQRNDGKVPDTLEGMIALMKAQFGDVQGTFLPEGRSLARFATDFKDPRTLVAGRWEQGSAPKSPSDLLRRLDPSSIYLGHASKTHSLEVISYNSKLGRYEFQVIKNFGPGLKPVVEYSDRALCMSCHSHGGPIFPGGPWDETENNVKVTQALMEENPHFDNHGLTGTKEIFSGSGKPFTRVFAFDVNVRNGSTLLYLQDFLKIGCGSAQVEAPECRRLIVELAFTDRYGDDRKTFKAKWERLDSLLSRLWPKEGIAVNQGDIPNRDPFKDLKDKPLSEYLDPLRARNSSVFKYGGFSRNRAGNSVAQDQFEVLNQVSTLFKSDEVIYIRQLAGGDLGKIHSALESPAMAHFFDGRVLNKSEFYRELLKNLGHPVEQDLWKLEEIKMPPMALAGQVLQDGTAKVSGHSEGELHLFKKNCASCHTGQSEPRMNFMEGASDEALLHQIRTNPEIARRLSWESLPEAQRMPPQRSRQGQDLRGAEAQDRLSMIGFLSKKSCPEALEGLLQQIK